MYTNNYIFLFYHKWLNIEVNICGGCFILERNQHKINYLTIYINILLYIYFSKRCQTLNNLDFIKYIYVFYF